MYRIIDVLLVAGLMASCTQVPSAPQKAEETEAASLDAAIDSNEDIIPPTNVTGSYLQCIEEENPSDNLQIRCSARDKETDSIIDLNSGFDNYIWSTQTLEAGITISQSTNPSTSEIRFIFEGLPYADAFALMERSQIKLQLFSGADSFFMSDFAISNDRQEVYRDFTIFEIEGSIINNYVEGANALTLPTAFAPYSGLQGCYVACYSVDDTDAVYRATSVDGEECAFHRRGHRGRSPERLRVVCGSRDHAAHADAHHEHAVRCRVDERVLA